MVFVAFRDASGRFRARVPSSWRIDRHPHGATVFSDQRWFEQVSVSVAAVAGPPGATCWRPLLDFPDILHELGGGSLARTWNGVHGASLFVVTHTFPALWGGAAPRPGHAAADHARVQRSTRTATRPADASRVNSGGGQVGGLRCEPERGLPRMVDFVPGASCFSSMSHLVPAGSTESCPELAERFVSARQGADDCFGKGPAGEVT